MLSHERNRIPLLDFVESLYSAIGQIMVPNHHIWSAVLVMLNFHHYYLAQRARPRNIVRLDVVRLSAMVISLGMLDGAISKNPPPSMSVCLPACLECLSACQLVTFSA